LEERLKRPATTEREAPGLATTTGYFFTLAFSTDHRAITLWPCLRLRLTRLKATS